MNAVFFHDARLKKNENKYYTSGGLNYKYLQRYLKNFTQLTLCTREEKVENKEKQKLSISSGKNIKFNGIKKLNFISLAFGKDREKIKQNIKDNDFAIIRLPSFIGIFASKECRKQKKDYMIEVVGCTWDALWNYGSIKEKVVAPISYYLNRKEIKKAQNVIYVSNEFLQKRYPTKGKYIGCSDVDIEESTEDILNRRLYKIKNEKNKKIKIGLIGSLNVDFKGHDTAIKAIARFKERNKYELHFLGTGDLNKWQNLTKKYQVDDQIKFDGVLPHHKVFEWLDDMDIYIIPSLQEGMPRALIEAMSRGCPCIGCKTGGIPELLDKEMLINKKDFKALGKKIEQLTNNEEEMMKQAKINFKKSKQFEKNVLLDKREKFIEQILLESKEKK